MNSIQKRKITKTYRKALPVVVEFILTIILGLIFIEFAFRKFDERLKYRECNVWHTRSDCPIRLDGLDELKGGELK